MFEDITGWIEDYSIKSVNGRHLRRDNVYNLVFNCKYYNLPADVQDAFLQGALSDLDYDLFREQLKEHIEETFKNNYVDWDNTGFYGRSSGNYCVSFFAGTIGDMIEYDFEWCNENYYYKDFMESYRDIQKAIKIMEYIKQYMIEWFTGALHALSSWTYNKYGHVTIKSPEGREIYLQIDTDVKTFFYDIGVKEDDLSAGDTGVYDDSYIGYFDQE